MFEKLKRNWRLIVLSVVLGGYAIEFVGFLLKTEGMRDRFFVYQFAATCGWLLVYFALAVFLHREWEDPRQKLWYRTLNLAAALLTILSLSLLLRPVMIYAPVG